MLGYYILSYFICQGVFSIKKGGLSSPDGLRNGQTGLWELSYHFFAENKF